MQPLQCILQHHVSNPHVSTHMATDRDNNHAAITLRSAKTDSKKPYNYAHINNHTWQNTKGEPIKRIETIAAAPAPHTQGTFHRRLQQLYTENTRFRIPASSPTQAPYDIHAAITMRFAASRVLTRMSRHTWQQNVTTIMRPLHCDLQAQIPKQPITTHTSTTTRGRTPRENRLRIETLATAPAARTHKVPSIAACSHFTQKNTGFRSPASSPALAPCDIHAAITTGFVSHRPSWMYCYVM